VLEREAQRLGLARHAAARAQELRRDVAEAESERKRRNPQECWPLQRMRDGAGQHLVAHRIGSDGVDGA
jgi:hypothetical protein